MAIITVSRDISAPVEAVWSVLEDFGGVHRFSMGVESSPINNGTPSTGLGAERTCHMYDGHHIQERVIESIPNKKLGIEIFETSMPLASGEGGFTLEPTAAGGTKVTMVMDYVVKYGPLGMVLDALMMKGMMSKNLAKLLATLDHHVLTGEVITPDWKATAKAA